MHDAVAAEDNTLSMYDFPLNDSKNGGFRPIQLPGNKKMGDYPVVDEELAAYAAALKEALRFKGVVA